MQERTKNADLITDAAFKLFKIQSIAKVSIGDICSEANITRSTFYRMFSGKNDLLIYKINVAKYDYEATLKTFAAQKNDFERMWKICDRFLVPIIGFGDNLTRELFKIDFETSLGLFELPDSMLGWHSELYVNCQKSGIIRSSTPADELVPLVCDLLTGICYEWCRSRGAFELRDRSRRAAEIVYDVAPQYRWTYEK